MRVFDDYVKPGEYIWLWRFMPYFRVRKTQGYGLCLATGYDPIVKTFSITVTIITRMFDMGVKFKRKEQK